MNRTNLARLALSCLLTLTPAALSHAADDAAPDTPAANAPGTDTALLYSIERHEAGALPMASQLRRLLPADTVVLTLEAGTQRFHALRQEPEQAEPTGAVLLLPDPGIGPAWLQQAAALRFDLARNGWLTLAVEPPPPDRPPVPERTLPVMKSIGAASAATGTSAAAPAAGNRDTGTDQTAATTPAAPFAERFQERVDLALEELRQTPTEVLIVVAFGRAAPWATQYVTEHPELNLALMLIDPLPDEQADAPNLDQLWSRLGGTRVIDLFHEPLPGYPQAAPDARVRRAQARRAELSGYYQSRIAAPFTGWNNEMPWLTRSARGLIRSRILEPLAAEKAVADNRVPAPAGQTPPGLPRN